MEERQFQQLMEESPLGVAVWRACGEDPADMVLEWANPQAGVAIGFDFASFIGSTMGAVFPQRLGGQPGKRSIDAAWLAAVRGERSLSEFGYSDSRVSWRWLRNEYVPLGDNRVAIFFADLTESRSESALDGIDAGVVVHKPDTMIVEANSKACELLGRHDVVGRLASDPVWVFLDGNMTLRPIEEFPVMEIIEGRSVRSQLLGIRHPDGRVIWCEVNARPRFDTFGDLSDIAVTFYDVTRRENARREAVNMNAQLIELSLTDPLTGMANRRGVFNEAERMRSDAIRHGHPLAVLVVDLDDLKGINDHGGHELGDALLGEIAKAITGQLRAEDFAGRIGGDEFLILLPLADLAESEAVAERMRIDASFRGATASFGAAVLTDGESVVALVRRADQALYQAKDSGGNTVEAAL